MTRKYHVASSAMTPKIPGTLSPGASDLIAKKMVNENARKSDMCSFWSQSVTAGFEWE